MKKSGLFNKLVAKGKTIFQKKSKITTPDVHNILEEWKEDTEEVPKNKGGKLDKLCNMLRSEKGEEYEDLENNIGNMYFQGSSIEEGDFPSLFIVVVGFHHTKGPSIEYTLPASDKLLNEDDEFVKQLIFIAIPDAAHTVDSDYACFIMQRPKKKEIYFGVTCFRQIEAKNLPKQREITRAFVQKAVCIVSKLPLFVPFLNKLNLTTHAYFNQKNFQDTLIMKEFYTNTIQYQKGNSITYSALCSGLPLGKLLLFLKEKLITVIKLLLLEKRIIVYSPRASFASTFVLSIISLFPGCITFGYDKSIKIKYYLDSVSSLGMPLQIFNNKTYFFPFFSLNELNLISQDNIGYFLGATNQLLLQYPKANCDCLINLDSNNVEISNPKLAEIVKPTKEDKIFIRNLIKAVQTQNIADDGDWTCIAGEVSGISHFEGSQDYILSKFKSYFVKFLAQIAYAQNSMRDKSSNNNLQLKDGSDEEERALSSEEERFVNKKMNYSPEERFEQVTKNPRRVNEGISPLSSPPRDINHEITKKSKSKSPRPTNNRYNNNSLSKELLKVFNPTFVSEWAKTVNFRIWLFNHNEEAAYLSNISGYKANGKIFYEDGSIYNGELSDGQREGFGSLNMRDGFTYLGTWLNDMRNGAGTLSGENSTYIYEGEWRDNQKHGKGQLISKDFKYSGFFEDDMFHGQGIHCDAEGNVYEGEWEHDQRVGIAHWRNAKGDQYIGEFIHNSLTGKGQMKYASGEVYSGSLRYGLRSGFGQQMWTSDGSTYEGEWEDDQIHGWGVMHPKDKSKIIGHWANGNFLYTSLKSKEKND